MHSIFIEKFVHATFEIIGHSCIYFSCVQHQISDSWHSKQTKTSYPKETALLAKA
jgi:hypothetical protein